jgi:hypothetical protein
MEYYFERGAQLDMPPDSVTKLYIDASSTQEYRKAPFIIQAAAANTPECFGLLIQKGAKLDDTGYIGLSKKRKNQVISNVIGAAAYNGGKDMLRSILTNLKHH